MKAEIGAAGIANVCHFNERGEMRTVMTYKHEREIVDGKSMWNKIEDGEGLFHKWGIGYDEFETGPGMFSTAIVEMPDGTVRNIPVELIKFQLPL